jgi:hypothetical protein
MMSDEAVATIKSSKPAASGSGGLDPGSRPAQDLEAAVDLFLWRIRAEADPRRKSPAKTQ